MLWIWNPELMTAGRLTQSHMKIVRMHLVGSQLRKRRVSAYPSAYPIQTGERAENVAATEPHVYYCTVERERKEKSAYTAL